MSEAVLNLSEEKAKETSMVDLTFELLKKLNTPLYYRDLMQKVAYIKGMSEKEVMDVIAQLYTEINIDGRFACVGENLWGLKRWYPMDKSEGAINTGKRFVNDDEDDEEEDDEFNYDDNEDDFAPLDDDSNNAKDSKDAEDNDEEEEEEIEDIDADEEIEEDIDELEESDEEDAD
ncbi:MAG: DNA-directed RNA polymerase subunit delta [Bacilli bacterium]